MWAGSCRVTGGAAEPRLLSRKQLEEYGGETLITLGLAERDRNTTGVPPAVRPTLPWLTPITGAAPRAIRHAPLRAREGY